MFCSIAALVLVLSEGYKTISDIKPPNASPIDLLPIYTVAAAFDIGVPVVVTAPPVLPFV